jgi:tetratricopeptide (TPR) repeat protein
MAILKRRLVREKKSPEARQPDGKVSQAEISADTAIPAQSSSNPGDSNSATSAALAQTDVVNPDVTSEPTIPAESALVPVYKRKLSLVQIVLIVGIILSASFLTYSLVESQSGKQSSLLADASAPTGIAYPERSVVSKNEPSRRVELQPPQSVAETNQGPSAKEDTPLPASQHGESPATQEEPLSLQLEENYYAAKDYVRTYSACERLRQNLTSPDFELIRDFLQLRMALCLEQNRNLDHANQLIRGVCESKSIALRAIANYHCSLLEMNSGQYLKARTRAYKTIALTGALAFDDEWALTLERECQFLAAEAITRQVLSLCDADKDLPRQLWSKLTDKDPLAGLDETQLQAVLNSGIERFNSGLLAPQIRAVEPSLGAPGLNRWSIVCSGPGIEELMARFAANASLDIRWMRPVETPEVKQAKTESRISKSSAESSTRTGPSTTLPSTTLGASGAGWNRSVTLYLPAATTQQVAVIAAGAVGLIAQVDDARLSDGAPDIEGTEAPGRSRAGTITITDPTEYSTLSEHTRMLNEHAIWLWRRLLLMYSDDQRIPNAHFALGILQGQKGQVAEAIAEYKLVSNRYSQTELAPFALLRSSRLKTDLRDYTGASRDLKQLIEQYHENELIGQAHLDLAETTMKAGLYDEACSLYKKAYNLGFSSESKTIAAFGAGKCFYQIKDYKSAVEWLTRYIEAIAAQQHPARTSAKSPSQNAAELYTAYLLLGKSNLALGNLSAACDALQFTVRRAAASDEYVEAISALVEAQIKQQDFVAALDTIENVRVWPFSQEQTTRLLLLKSGILRTIGLTDQAITLLSDRAQYLTDPRLKAEIIFELARCYVASKNLELARSHLTEVLSLVEPGPLAQQASVELAEVCLKLGEYQQTISICTQLLNSSAAEQIKQQCSKILVSAYSKQQDYDKAAMSLVTASVLPEKTKSGHE